MPQFASTRRELFKRSATIAGLGMAGALSGCSGDGGNPFGDSGDSGDGGDGGGDGGDGSSDGGDGSATPVQPGLDAVPASATAVVDIDVEAFLNDQELKTILNASAESSSGMTVDQQMQAVKQSQGIDPGRVTRLLGFGDSMDSVGAGGSVSGDAYGGAIMWSSLSKETVLSAMRDSTEGSLSESTYSGTTLYSAGTTGQYTAFLGGGVVVAGTKGATEDVIDLVNGSGSAVSGEVRNVFQSTKQGPARFAFQVPDMSSGGSENMQMSGLVTKMTWVSGSILYDAGGSNRGFSAHLRFQSSSDAQQTNRMLQTLLSQYKQQLSQSSSESAQQLAAALDKMSTSQNGKTVTITYEDTVSNIAASIESSGGMMGVGGGNGGGGGGGGGGSTSTPSQSIDVQGSVSSEVGPLAIVEHTPKPGSLGSASGDKSYFPLELTVENGGNEQTDVFDYKYNIAVYDGAGNEVSESGTGSMASGDTVAGPGERASLVAYATITGSVSDVAQYEVTVSCESETGFDAEGVYCQ